MRGDDHGGCDALKGFSPLQETLGLAERGILRLNLSSARLFTGRFLPSSFFERVL